MDTLAVLTLRLAEGLGIYLLAAGLGIVIAPARWEAIVADLQQSPALVYVAGVLAFAIGAAIFGIHHSLHDPLAIIVTICAFAIAIEGLVLIVRPETALALGRALAGSARLWSIAAAVAGLLLFLAGYLGRADTTY
jgi:hypothetical protein